MSTYKVFTLKNFTQIPQVNHFLSEIERHAIEVVGNVLPFKVNNYVVDYLINWDNVPNDPIFQLTFPQREMLSQPHFTEMEVALREKYTKEELKLIANKIRFELNPHPSGQQKNVPVFKETSLTGIQHKYKETVLFFPSNSQTCHAYCTFCFRWPQFVGINDLKFAMKETLLLAEYIKEHTEVTDVLFTGGDPMVMSAKKFAAYIDPLINDNVPNLKTIRIGTKVLGYWPYKFLTDKDHQEMLDLFKKIVDQGYNLSIMAHFNHPRELETEPVKQAIKKVLGTGAQIRTQSPIMKHINDSPDVWRDMWKLQLDLGCIPYYMFIARDTGAQDYFAVSLENAWEIFRDAYKQVSGVARTVRGPSMSADPGKIHVVGTATVNGEKVFVLRFLQARNPEWVGKPFFAHYDPSSIWIDSLKPFSAEKFFYEEEV